ncbi:MAG: PAS domain S-box protein [Actinomycetota bacterium]|nr:PAS domain S-box protein [Actinomycetota bacterium]
MADPRCIAYTLFDLNPDAVFCVSPEGLVTDVNRAAEKLAVRTRDELVGHPFVEFISPGALDQARALFGRVAAGEEVVHENVTMRTSDGEDRVLDVSAYPSITEGRLAGICGIARDISDRVREREELLAAQQALRDSEELLRQLTDNIEQIFYVGSVDTSELLYLSPAYETIWGRSREEALTTPWRWLEGVHPEDRARVRRLAEEGCGGFDVAYRVVKPDGSIRWVQDKGFSVRDEHGEVIRVAGVVEDVTERKALQEQLQQAQRMESVGRLAGGVAHDFNNLLMIILNAAEFVREGIALDDPARQDIDDIVAAGQKGAALVRQLLTYSRRQLVNPKVLDVNDIINEMKDLLQRSLGEDLILTVKQEPRLPQTRIDPNQLRQVIMNLLVNARDAMGQGGMVTIESSTVALSEDLEPGSPAGSTAGAGGRYVCIAVSDTGRGIDPSIIDNIFEPFFSTKPMAEASGLGLSTVYGIVTQAGGRIAVHSEPGVGATFKVYLPAEETLAAPAPSAARRRSHGGTGTVLVAEDDPLVLGVASRILSRRGFEVLHAATGKEALDRCRQHDGVIDLLLTDVVMPLMSGRELASHVKVLRPETKILYMSGYSEDMIGRHGVLQEDENYMQKPFTSLELLDKIEAVLRER